MLYAISCHGDRKLDSICDISTNRIIVPNNMKFISLVETGTYYSVLLSHFLFLILKLNKQNKISDKINISNSLFYDELIKLKSISNKASNDPSATEDSPITKVEKIFIDSCFYVFDLIDIDENTSLDEFNCINIFQIIQTKINKQKKIQPINNYLNGNFGDFIFNRDTIEYFKISLKYNIIHIIFYIIKLIYIYKTDQCKLLFDFYNILYHHLQINPNNNIKILNYFNELCIEEKNSYTLIFYKKICNILENPIIIDELLNINNELFYIDDNSLFDNENLKNKINEFKEDIDKHNLITYFCNIYYSGKYILNIDVFNINCIKINYYTKLYDIIKYDLCLQIKIYDKDNRIPNFNLYFKEEYGPYYIHDIKHIIVSLYSKCTDLSDPPDALSEMYRSLNIPMINYKYNNDINKYYHGIYNINNFNKLYTTKILINNPDDNLYISLYNFLYEIYVTDNSITYFSTIINKYNNIINKIIKIIIHRKISKDYTRIEMIDLIEFQSLNEQEINEIIEIIISASEANNNAYELPEDIYNNINEIKKIYIIELINEIDDVDIYNILIYIYNIIFKAFNISMNTLIEIIENEINNTNKDEEKIFLLCFCNSIDIKCKLTNEHMTHLINI